MRDFSVDLAWAKIQAVITALGGWLGLFLGGCDNFLYALLILTILDFISGVLVAIVQKKLSSSIGFKGISRKVLMFGLVGIAALMDQKIIGTGTIHCDSADPTMRDFDIKNIKNPFDTKEQLSELVEKNRRENHVYMRENMMTGGNGADLDMDPGEMFGQDDDCDGNH